MGSSTNYKSLDEFFNVLPPVQVDCQLRQKIRNGWLHNDHKLIVLDDDPTGVQTVHDIPVITDWSKEWIRQGLLDSEHLL